MLLPTRIAIGPEESLDSFLERLAAANDLRPTQLLRLVRTVKNQRPSFAFFDVRPDPILLTAIESLSGIAAAVLERATLLRYGDGLPYRLDDLDPGQRHSYRHVVSQGWFPTTGSQACSMCLRENGVWRVEWRLPLTALCSQHGTFLTTACTGCGRRFRSHHYSPLRTILGTDHPCGNPLSLRTPCRHSVLNHSPQSAPASLVNSARAIRSALSGTFMTMLGDSVDPRIYLSEMRHVATLLLHLASRPRAVGAIEWADELHAEAQARAPQLRGPRWGYSAPQSACVRGHVTHAAHRILSAPDLKSAGAQLASWTTLVADEANGPSAWMVNRTTRSKVMEALIHSATEDRHHVGRRLSKLDPPVTAPTVASVPQLYDAHLFRMTFAGMLGGYEHTGRLYVSLCVTRALTGSASWADAAEHLGLDRSVGSSTARAASRRMRVSPEKFAQAVQRSIQALPRDHDFRKREARVILLARNPHTWHPQWRNSSVPARRSSSLPYAITWMWCEVCQGCLHASPAWGPRPSHRVTAAYRAFKTKLPSSLQDSLRALVLSDSRP